MPKRKGKGQSSNDSKIKRLKIEHDVSEYERRRLENIRKNNQLLAELNIVQARDDLSSISSLKKPTVKPIKMKVKNVKEKLPRRKSLRIRRIAPDGFTKLPETLPTISSDIEQPRHRGELEMKVINDMDEKDSKAFLVELEELMTKTSKLVTKKSVPKKTVEFIESRYKNLQVKENHVIKVVPQGVFSLEFHRGESKVLLFAGDKWGRLGIWDVNSKEKDKVPVMVYEPHTKRIIKIAFDPLDPSKLVTASYDGMLRCADLTKSVFNEVFALDEDDSYFTYFGFGTPSSHTVIASSADGQVRVVDCRKKRDSWPHFRLHDDKKINCLDVSPQRPDMFLTTSKGQIAIWDIRNIKGPSSHLSTIERSRTITSAFFSPNNGQQILATGMDNLLTVNEVTTAGVVSSPPSCTYSHDNQTGRWLATFHAKWDPINETCFAVGSMKYPRQIDVFSTKIKGSPLIRLRHENFTTITSRIAFHPTLNMMAGGNSSGKVFVWNE